MDPKYYGLIEMGLSFGVVAIFTIQQLWSLRDKPSQPEPPPAGTDSGSEAAAADRSMAATPTEPAASAEK